MPDINPIPPRIPHPISSQSTVTQRLGSDPKELEPIVGLAAPVECILRQPRRVMCQLQQPSAGLLALRMVCVALLCGLVYGLVVGLFSGGAQLWAAPAKIAGGLLISTMICLPSLYIFTCLSGSQARLAEIWGLVAGLLLLMTILLIGFAPVAWLFSQSTNSTAWMGGLHLLFWFVATGFGLRFIDTAFSHSQARSKAGLRAWIVIFMLVAVQMTTALRPIVGPATTFLPAEKKFFLAHWADCMSAAAEHGLAPRSR